MAIVADVSSTDLYECAGLPHDAVAAWLASGGTLDGDHRRAIDTFSRQWRLGTALLEGLPAKPKRSPAQAAAAAAIVERDRAAREVFLGAH
ncbi:MAG: hypothetical protein WBD71_20165, partial [Xanthobacteraceae bacterium]